MSWCRLEDDMDENRKLRRLSHEAFRLYWIGVTYARRQQTGGRLHLDDIQDLAARHRIKNVKAAIADLVHVPEEYGYEFGCWELVSPDLYQVHDHEEYNPPTSKERMRRKRERDRASQGDDPDPDRHGCVTSPPVTESVTRDGAGDHHVTGGDVPRAQERAGYPDPVPEPVPDTTGLRPSVIPPGAPPADGMPQVVRPAVARRVEALREGCERVLARPLRGDERPVVLGWAALERQGEPVPVAEILDLARHLLLTPTRDSTLPGTLRYCDATVLALARAPWAGPAPLRPPSLLDVANAIEAGGEPPLRLMDGGRP